MRITKKVIAAVLILCMLLQISGTAVIADDAANSRGIEIIAARDVDVDEDITVTGGDQGATGIKASAEGKSVTSEVETGSGMKVKSEGSSVGIEASASDGGSLSVDFEGSIDVSSGSGSSVGISAHADSGSSVSIEVG